MLKSDYAGDLRLQDVGRTVTLAGWVHRRRDLGGLIFIDLRDKQGIVQVVFGPDTAAHAVAEQVRNEYVLRVEGVVERREPKTVNAKLATGEIEVRATTAEVLNPAKMPPFAINEEGPVEESLRLRYRYLDLRRPVMRDNLLIRHRTVKYIRDFLSERGFLEIETPMLIKSTPEGARDYLVPSRVHPGQFYALPQSPQQLKQLLMVAGVERYFQIARCFRDEDLRADRQPEFTQLDLEMSFVDQDDVLDLMEELFTGLVDTVTPQLKVLKPWPRLTWHEAMARYGSDKPDLRFGLEIHDLAETLAGTEARIFRHALDTGGTVGALCLSGQPEPSRRTLDEWSEIAKGGGAQGLAWVVYPGGEGSIESVTHDELRSSVKNALSGEEFQAIARATGAKRGDVLLIVAAAPVVVWASLGRLRGALGKRLDLADPNLLAWARVTDFPLLEWNAEQERWDSSHHPFTAPFAEDVPLLDTDPGRVRSKAYDLVCNGYEVASGSIRIHRRELQQKIFNLLGFTPEDAQARFGALLDAFEYGAPPHGGIAPGIDRITMLLAGQDNIREVIAFPKTQSASDLMMGAPSPVDPVQLADLYLSLRLPEPHKEDAKD